MDRMRGVLGCRYNKVIEFKGRIMRVFRDHIGREIRLTDDAIEHISEDHPELLHTGLESSIADTVADPDIVLRSRRREIGELFFKQRTTDPFLNRHICVVVKMLDDYGYVWTAYIVNRLRRGDMEKRAVKVRYDADLDFLEVLFEQKEGYFEPVEDGGLMIRYDEEGNVIGFAIDGLTAVEPDGIDIVLTGKGLER